MNTKTSFALKIVKHLLDNNFSVLLHNKEDLDGYGGWLEVDGDNRELCVAMKHHMGFEILLHEYCHFLQYKTDRAFWDLSNEHYDYLFDWVSDLGTSIDNSLLDKSLESIIRIEHDCEKRVLKIVELNPIEDFDVIKYKKAINAYLWSYHIVREIRQRPKRPIYTEEVLQGMPQYFNNDVSFYLDKSNLSKELRDSLMIGFI